MSPGKRQPPAPSGTEKADDPRQVLLRETFRGDLTFWIASEPRIALRIMKLIDAVVREPFAGIGKPEGLKHDPERRWSRRITDEHRLVYAITSAGPTFYQARYHYRR